ncbi:PAS domain S-box protein [uncultured Thiodictyon sp.]|jgi:PAS domain-containing protein|uniref:PAS domain S-box protein n=1 Tax=uncultured Thiodictyon sp. TaxID=1846217 RepID=UPI0025D416D3|nr:PAS domain S-box protein [uncultured Thiodictyon sp.]
MIPAIAAWGVAVLCLLVAPGASSESPRPLLVGSETGFPPYADADASGRAIGFSVDLFSAVARVMDIPVQYRVSDWDQAWHGLLNGEVDALPLVAQIKALDQGLLIVKTNGEYQQIYDRWLGIYEPSPFPLTVAAWTGGGLERNYFNFRHRIASGEVRDVEVFSSPVDVSGRPLLFSIVHDITHRKQVEAALRVSEETFRTLAESAPVGIYLTSPDGASLYANKRWCDMAGMAPTEAIGNGWLSAVHPENRASVASDWQRMIESGGSWDQDISSKS